MMMFVVSGIALIAAIAMGAAITIFNLRDRAFSGAEIEQGIVAAQYAALADNVTLSQAHIEKELAQTRPLSVIRAEDFQTLRGWARQRCVMVDNY